MKLKLKFMNNVTRYVTSLRKLNDPGSRWMSLLISFLVNPIDYLITGRENIVPL